MSVYFGLAEGSKEISGIYLGTEESIKEVSEGYIGDSDGNINSIISSVEPGQQIFTSSGTFTVPKGVKKVDIFLVGGGGCGHYATWRWYSAGFNVYHYNGGVGGAGGCTKTVKGISVKPQEEYNIIVGSGQNKAEWDVNRKGGSSTAFGYEADGGESGRGLLESQFGTCGGSGGGVGGHIEAENTVSNIIKSCKYGGRGGEDGSDGYWYSDDINGIAGGKCSISKGQGSTTRAFGESSGTLYSGGGGGGGYTWSGFDAEGGAGGGGHGGSGLTLTSGSEGTGGGGGGHSFNQRLDCAQSGNGYRMDLASETCGASGGSGIVIIRWGY